MYVNAKNEKLSVVRFHVFLVRRLLRPSWNFFAAARILEAMERFAAEKEGINLYAEYSLHEGLKEYLASPGDRLEAPVEGKVIDLVRASGELIEVQTRQLGKIASKVLALAAKGYNVRVVHPIEAERLRRRVDPTREEVLGRQRDPERGDLYALCDERVDAPGLIAERSVTVGAVLGRSVETKTRDGTGSWRRRGDRTVDRELAGVISSRAFRTKSQWLALIPKDLPAPWTSAALGKALGIAPERARKILYCFCRAGLLVEAGKIGRAKAYGKA